MFLSRSLTGRLFHSCDPAVVNLLSPSCDCVHGTRVDVWWPEVPTSHLRDELAVVREVLRDEAMQSFVLSIHHQFEVDFLLHRQPMKLSQHWSDVVTSTSSSDEPCCCVLYRLQQLNQTARDVIQHSARYSNAVGRNERVASSDNERAIVRSWRIW